MNLERSASLIADLAAPGIPREVRAILVMALVGLVLTGVLLMTITWLWGRRLRRISRSRPPERPREVSDWDRKQPASPHGEPPMEDEI